MRPIRTRLLLTLGLVVLSFAFTQTPLRTLRIYFIDVEGGQATLIILPGGQTLMIDSGFPGDGTFRSKPGDPANARDAQRIAAAARDAGVSRIDFLLITHFHADHVGGVPELSQLLPIGTFIDHGTVRPEAEQTVGGTLEAFERYEAVRSTARHIEPSAGERLPLDDVNALVVSSGGTTIEKPVDAAGRPNPACRPIASPAQEPNENPRSTGVLLEFGKFRFLDVGDLTGAPLFDLACPNDLIGAVDAYLVAHHGGVDAADPATFAAFQPRVAILNNGPRKGGAAETFATLHQARGLADVWQLDRSLAAAAENFSDERIANLDQSTAHWIKLAAQADGSFEVRNGRTGVVVPYGPR
jgi:competence protein ComEC